MPSGLHQIRKLKIFGAILALSFLTVPILLSTLFLLTHPVSALDPTHTTDGSPITHGLDLELNVAPTLQVVIPTSTVSLTLTPNPDPSIPVFASENLVVSVATNNPTGYSLMLKADSTNLTNTVADREGNYSILPTLVDQVGGYTEESFTTNTWGYRNTNTLLNNIVTNNTTGNYNAFTTSSEILSSKLPTNLDQTSLDFAAKIDITQPAGTYELALNFEAVTNVMPGVVTITFDPNTGTGQMPVQQIESGTSQNLTPNTFTKEHYIFTGWNTKPDGTGTHYDNEQSYETVLDVLNKSVTLYAQWELETYNITLSRNSATAIVIDGISYTDDSVNLSYGDHTIGGTFSSGYEFVSWATSGDLSVSSTSSVSTTLTVGGAGTLTLTGKTSVKSMQNYTKATCQTEASSANVTVVDTRDNNSYTVRYINGNCWMTQNLRIAGGKTLTSSDSNVSANYTIPTTDLTSGNTYTEGRIHNSGNTTNGYWYNYCAASAGTICTSSNSTNATYDICPKGWRLPTNSEQSGITSYASAFSPVTGGYYYIGSLGNTGSGYWWSSTAGNTAGRYGLSYNGSSLNTGGNGRFLGFYVRCIRSS